MSLRLPGNQTLKGKRQVAQSIIPKVRSKFNVAVAEVEDGQLQRRLTLGIACISNDSRHANEVISRVVQYIRDTRLDTEFLDYEIEIITGV